MSDPTPREFCRRHYAVLAALVLGVAAFNLTFRLDREFVTEWDESLYAMSAWEMFESGDWIGVRMFGNLDYSNTKPPLNVWLLVIAFKIFGRGLFALRFFSVLSAWLTILALIIWSKRRFGPDVAVVAGTVLATAFGFLHVHSGRTANTDALFTLLSLLVVITLDAETRRPWRRLYLAPLVAAAFLLRGMGVLMPLAIVLVVDVVHWPRWRERVVPSTVTWLLTLVPVAAWGWARYRLDGFRFLEPMFGHDFVARTLMPLDGHTGGPFYYANILLKHHYDWIAAGVIAVLLVPGIVVKLRSAPSLLRADPDLSLLIGAWAASTLLIPTVMATKTPWYLNTFYPLFAIGVAYVLVYAVRQLTSMTASRARLGMLATAALLAFTVAEAKLWAYSVKYRDLNTSAQGLLLAEGGRLAGRRVYRDRLDRSTTFVAGLVGAELLSTESYTEAVRRAWPRDLILVSSPPDRHRRQFILVAANEGNWLLVRRESKSSY